MTKEITVGIWENAPFRSAIERGIDALNLLLKSKNALVSYNLIKISPKKPKPIDILFLDGGADIDPKYYKQANRYSYTNPKRDAIEFDLFNFYKDKSRISGACRGHQLINVALGGSLFQDIYSDGIVHNPHKSPHYANVFRSNKPSISQIKNSNSFLSPFLSEDRIQVSSLHHQAINKFARGIYQTLRWNDSPYGSINEGIESLNGGYRGLQSHPEFGMCKNDGYLFSYLMHVDAFAKDFLENSEDNEVEQKEKVRW
jgi:putative glutamine amidotransferase